MKKLPFDKFVEVVWLDAASHEGWVEVDGDNEPMQIITRGWLIKETSTYIMLAASLQVDVAATVGSTQIIPLGMIVSQRELKVTNVKSRTRASKKSENSQAELPSPDIKR